MIASSFGLFKIILGGCWVVSNSFTGLFGSFGWFWEVADVFGWFRMTSDGFMF